MAPDRANLLSRLLGMARHTVAVFKAKETPLYVKIILGLGLLYIISPWDLLPETLPVLGIVDDFTLAALLIAWANGFRLPEQDDADEER
ncbi:MAG: YkvA family protein [Candidatus Electrothrix sp. GW3-4]|uniref:YkvA family protein n=1 Tax=Candidatus Electrothrix sp. GW3-4 TaxID=3126740 RepID=UPI0030D30153